jgi:hypothetical protein
MGTCSASATMIVGVASAANDRRSSRNKRVQPLAILLSVGVLTVPSPAMRMAASVMGFTLSP